MSMRITEDVCWRTVDETASPHYRELPGNVLAFKGVCISPEPKPAPRRIEVRRGINPAIQRVNRRQARTAALDYSEAVVVTAFLLVLGAALWTFGPDLNQWVISHPLHLWGV